MYLFHVTSRKGRVSRNVLSEIVGDKYIVTSRKGRVSRNHCMLIIFGDLFVTSRKGRVSRNNQSVDIVIQVICHVP